MVSLVVASPPTRGTRLYPCIEEEDADAVLREWPEEVGDMMSSLVNDLNPLDDDDDDDIAYPKETPPKLLQVNYYYARVWGQFDRFRLCPRRGVPCPGRHQPQRYCLWVDVVPQRLLLEG